MKKFKPISAGEADRLIETRTPLILDCRELKDYRAGHIDDAMHLHERLRETLILKGDKRRPVLIYCYYGHASEHVAEMFCEFDFSEVYSLSGGFAGWKEYCQQLPS